MRDESSGIESEDSAKSVGLDDRATSACTSFRSFRSEIAFRESLEPGVTVWLIGLVAEVALGGNRP